MHELNCNEVLGAVVLFIDHELSTSDQYQSFEIHFQNCLPCSQQMERERHSISMMQNLLRATCNEVAPEELMDRIQADINLIAGNTIITQTFVTEIVTEISIEIRHDFFGE